MSSPRSDSDEADASLEEEGEYEKTAFSGQKLSYLSENQNTNTKNRFNNNIVPEQKTQTKGSKGVLKQNLSPGRNE
jgi:hypothetical protein